MIFPYFSIHATSDHVQDSSGRANGRGIEVSKVFSHGGVVYPRDALVRPAEQNDLSNFTERKRFPSAPKENTSDFPQCAALLGIRAPRNFYYRARGAREGPPIYSSRKDFGSFAYYAIKVSLIEIPATFVV